jgi:2-methylcitrate dehydratase PrpD
MMRRDEHELAELAAFVADLDVHDLPDDVRDRATLLLADTVGAIVAGSTATELAAFRLGAVGGSSTVLAADLPGAPPPEAAFANGLAATWLEVDEVGPWGHAAAHLVPALLAASESERRTGAELLGAFIAGYEVHARLGLAATLRPVLHQNGNIGVMAAAVALAKLHRASATETLDRAAMAAQLMMGSSYAGSVAGATVRNVHPALAARAAFLIEDLDRCGFTGYPAAVSEVLGNALGTEFDAATLVAGLGEDWAVREAAVKLHSGCGHLHPVFDALADAFGAAPASGTYPPVRIEGVAPHLIERVDVGVVPGAERLADPHPANALAARFSIPYGVAVFLITGAADVQAFDLPPAVSSSVESLARRVHVRAEPELVRGRGALPARVAIYLTDGHVLDGRCEAPYGWPARPARPTDVAAKFGALCTPVLGPAAADLWEACMSLDDRTAFSLRGERREVLSR